MSYPERVLLLTGAGGRLGEAFCRSCASRYRIVAVYRRRQPAMASQHQFVFDPLASHAPVAENAHPLFAIQSDLVAPGEVDRVVELALARFDRLDVIVNAAVQAVWSPIVSRDRLLDTAEEQFRLNTILPLKLAAAAARQFWRDRKDENVRENRNVVNVSSTSGVYVYPGLGQSVYSASKAALNYLTAHMADEFSEFGVRVNATAPNSFPGYVPTADVVGSVVKLADGSMTGHILVVDSGGEQLL